MACEMPNNWATLEQEPAVIEPKASLIRIRFPVIGENINSRSTHRMKNGTDLATKSISPYSAANLSSKFYILNQDSQRFLRLKKKNLSLKKLNDCANCLQKRAQNLDLKLKTYNCSIQTCMANVKATPTLARLPKTDQRLAKKQRIKWFLIHDSKQLMKKMFLDSLIRIADSEKSVF